MFLLLHSSLFFPFHQTASPMSTLSLPPPTLSAPTSFPPPLPPPPPSPLHLSTPSPLPPPTASPLPSPLPHHPPSFLSLLISPLPPPPHLNFLLRSQGTVISLRSRRSLNKSTSDYPTRDFCQFQPRTHNKILTS